jgi:hypothetical protein
VGNVLTDNITEGGLGDFNVFPHIEFSPIENGVFGLDPIRAAFITWTYAVDAEPPEHQFHDVEIHSITSFRLLNYGYSPISLFNGEYNPGGRNGCAVFTACWDTGSEHSKGALVWLNDQYNPEYPCIDRTHRLQNVRRHGLHFRMAPTKFCGVEDAVRRGQQDVSEKGIRNIGKSARG